MSRAPQDPPRRLGPRPLALHLAHARWAWGGSDRDAAARAALEDFLCGVRAYWRHPYRRRPRDVPVLWQDGSSRLLDFGGAGRPVVAVPSLINRAYILDLLPERSLLGHLAGHGFRALLLDWGEPGPIERRMRLQDYILGRLGGALSHLATVQPQKPVLLGYCMGGLLTLGLAAHRRHAIAGLALLATPWDFAAYGIDPARFAALLGGPCTSLAGRLGGLPVEVIQSWFASVDPLQVPRKFAHFARLPARSREAVDFVAVEDWLNDGIPLGAEVARECLLEWYVANRPGRGEWRVGGVPVRPETLDLPALVAIPARDRIVPPASAAALAGALGRATVVRPAGGHIGMVVGARARTDLWRPLTSWLNDIAAMQN
jgi:polyhydroxyalkanoate synthase